MKISTNFWEGAKILKKRNSNDETEIEQLNETPHIPQDAPRAAQKRPRLPVHEVQKMKDIYQRQKDKAAFLQEVHAAGSQLENKQISSWFARAEEKSKKRKV